MNYRERVAVITGASSGIGKQIASTSRARGAARGDRGTARGAARAGRGASAEPRAPRSRRWPAISRSAPSPSRSWRARRRALRPPRLPGQQRRHPEAQAVLRRDARGHRLHDARELHGAGVHDGRRAARRCCAQGEGYIVNISSGAGKIPPPRETVYAASKFALTGFTEGLWLDLAGSNIHAAVIHVGPIDTEIWDKAAAEAPVRYHGKKYPPSVDLQRRLRMHREEALRDDGAASRCRGCSCSRSLLPGLFRSGAARWDPVPRGDRSRAPASAERKRAANERE